jgi:phage shock protein PspC (stress-responsive transcriptional regulator)
MKQVININFQGSIIPIEVTAYDMLKNYIDSLSNHFANEEGKEEIINDIESRVAELFQERLKRGANCIIDTDVEAIMTSIGRPSDLGANETNASASTQKEETKTDGNNTYNYSTKRKLFRDENHKLVGGVCSGIANYFDIDIVVVRIIFLILLFSFGVGFIPYIILWIVVPSTATQQIGSRRKRLFRDLDDKYLGGVCSGIANYFGISVWIPRLAFLLPMISIFRRNHWFGYNAGFDFDDVIRFGPGTAFIIYIILWLVLPEAKTTTEKLEMKGEKVDINSIKESVTDELKGVQVRAQKFGKEIITTAQDKGKVFGTELSGTAKKSGRTLGDIIVILVKAFVYFLIGVIGISILIALFASGTAAVSVFPLKDFILTAGKQNIYAWGVLIFFILVPIIGIITWIIRRVTKVKSGSKLLGLSFSAMWGLGWVFLTLLLAALSSDFKYNANINEEEVALVNPKVNSLEITDKSNSIRYINRGWYYNNNLSEDTFYARNVGVQIVKASNDSFKIVKVKLSNGGSVLKADALANSILHNINQVDTTLYIQDRIAINKTDKFRNQRVLVTIYVPVGKRIKVGYNYNTVNTLNFSTPFSISYRDDRDFLENAYTNWNEGAWYTMTNDGLVADNATKVKNRVNINSKGIDIDNGNNKVRINENGISIEDDNTGNYRYDNDNTPQNKFDSIKQNVEKAERLYKDSLQKEKEKIERQLEKYEGKETAMYRGILSVPVLMSKL